MCLSKVGLHTVWVILRHRCLKSSLFAIFCSLKIFERYLHTASSGGRRETSISARPCSRAGSSVDWTVLAAALEHHVAAAAARASTYRLPISFCASLPLHLEHALEPEPSGTCSVCHLVGLLRVEVVVGTVCLTAAGAGRVSPLPLLGDDQAPPCAPRCLNTCAASPCVGTGPTSLPPMPLNMLAGIMLPELAPNAAA